MASSKMHAFHADTNANPSVLGQESCDFRAENYVGDMQGDHHMTIFEKEEGPDVNDSELIRAILEDGPEWNRITARFIAAGLKPTGPLASIVDVFGGHTGLRVGVWDN